MSMRVDSGKKQVKRLPLGVIPTTQLADGEFISFRVRVPSGSILKIYLVGVQNESNNAPAGLTAEVDDETNTSNIVSENSKRTTGNPLASISGPIDAAFRIENDTGSQQNASGHFAYEIT